MAEMIVHGVTAVSMEVCALASHRADGGRTRLHQPTVDHLDFHGAFVVSRGCQGCFRPGGVHKLRRTAVINTDGRPAPVTAVRRRATFSWRRAPM
jgi:hypothetical protein